MADDSYRSRCLRTEFSGIPVYTFPMKVKDVALVSYAAVRGVDREEAAVQRVLNRRRVDSIKKFVLAGNMFFNTFILNWTCVSPQPKYTDGEITLPILGAMAQTIDGQHRLAGLEAAMSFNPVIGDEEILVSLCIGLSTAQAATIFVNINSEQRPVPKSLIYDLFGEVEADPDHAVNRANDIAQELQENPESPYYKAIKYPGTPRGAGIIDLSTVVSSLKPHLEREGVFARVNLRSLNLQKQVVLNYFRSIRSYYEEEGIWNYKAKNPFFSSAGFNGAVDYLTSTLITKCAEMRSFTEDAFRSLLRLDSGRLLTHQEIKHMDGKTARKAIADYLHSHLLSELPQQEDYEI